MAIIQISKIQNKRGEMDVDRTGLPLLAPGELGYATNRNRLFIGNTGAVSPIQNTEILTQSSLGPTLNYNSITGKVDVVGGGGGGGATYQIDSVSALAPITGANLRLVGSDGSIDSVRFAPSGSITITSSDPNTITIGGGGTSYALETANASSPNTGTELRLVGSNGTTDTIKFLSTDSISITSTDENTLLFSGVTYSLAAGDSIENGVPIQLNASDSTTSTVFIQGGSNVTIETVPTFFGNIIQISSSGGAAAGIDHSIQFNSGGTFDGSNNFLFDFSTNKLTIGSTASTGSLIINGSSATISNPDASGNIRVNPGDTGALLVGPDAASSIINGAVGQSLTVAGDTGLQLQASSGNISMLVSSSATKVTIQGVSASAYSSGLSDNDLVNKYYVDNNGGGGGGGGTSTLNVITTSTNYTTTLASNQSLIVLDFPTSTVTTMTIDGSLPYPVGTTISFFNSSPSPDTMLIALNTGILLQTQTGLTGTRTLTAYGMATAIKIKSATGSGLWIINGSGLV